MKSSILSVGTELLFGQIVNTNTVYLSQQLNTLGIDVMSHHTVGDNSKRLSNMIRQSFEECDLIITTGGLGPTQDDLTKEVACEVLDDELVFHKPAMDILEGHFKRFGS
ncbi:MAG: competence/damage-inducible protein A, partial [Clostridiales bacterium]|nr:competence/damage-inducible protein A [Clostridiales bacterium]